MSAAPSPGRGRLYSAFGLIVLSDLPCPGLPGGRGEPDVVFREGAVPPELADRVDSGVCFQTAPGRALVHVEGTGRFLVSEGQEIVIDRAPGASDDALRVFLLGTCLGVLLQQRGALVLHATTVVREGRAVALAGPSGVGKTTLGAALLERGYSLVADESTLVSISPDGPPLAVPGAPSLHVWRSALRRLELWSDELRPVRPGLEKYQLHAGARFAERPVPLTHIFRLGLWNRDEVGHEPLTGFARFQALLDNTFREPYLFGLGLARQRQERCAALVSRVRVQRLSWSRRWADLDRAAEIIDRVTLPGRGVPAESRTHKGAVHVG